MFNLFTKRLSIYNVKDEDLIWTSTPIMNFILSVYKNILLMFNSLIWVCIHENLKTCFPNKPLHVSLAILCTICCLVKHMLSYLAQLFLSNFGYFHKVGAIFLHVFFVVEAIFLKDNTVVDIWESGFQILLAVGKMVWTKKILKDKLLVLWHTCVYYIVRVNSFNPLYPTNSTQ